MTIDLYYTPASGPCRSVLLVIKMLRLDVNLKELNLLKKEQLAPEFVNLNPQHTVPTLVDNGFVIWESYAILTYLIQKYAKNDALYPKDPKMRAVINQRLYFDMGTLGRSFGDYYYPILFQNASPDPEKHAKIVEAFKFLDGFLDGHSFVAGDALTVADIALAVTVSTCEVAKFDITAYKNVVKWHGKVKTTVPGYEAISGNEMLSKLFEHFLKNK